MNDDSNQTKRGRADVETAMGGIVARHASRPADIIKGIPRYFRRYHMARFLCHYELFRKIIDVPGDIVELGVFRGDSLLSFANFLEIHCMGDRVRKVFGFDHWKGLQDLRPEDGPDDLAADKRRGGWCAGDYLNELRELIGLWDRDRFVAHVPRIELVDGDVRETIPAFVRKRPGTRISLLHIDLDLYEPTKVALEHLYPLVVSGGIVILDEYAVAEFAGESRAVDEYFGKNLPDLKTFPWFSSPGAYFVK